MESNIHFWKYPQFGGYFCYKITIITTENTISFDNCKKLIIEYQQKEIEN